MTDRADIERILDANRYLVLATVDRSGTPWASPVFFAPLDDAVCWVSSPDSRHSRNIAEHPGIAVTVFDSTVQVGHAEAVYVDATAGPADDDVIPAALAAMNARLPDGRELSPDDLLPDGPLVLYRAEVRRTYVLVRGGDPEHGNELDMTLEVPARRPAG